MARTGHDGAADGYLATRERVLGVVGRPFRQSREVAALKFRLALPIARLKGGEGLLRSHAGAGAIHWTRLVVADALGRTDPVTERRRQCIGDATSVIVHKRAANARTVVEEVGCGLE